MRSCSSPPSIIFSICSTLSYEVMEALYKSQELKSLFRAKGIPDSAPEEILDDIDSDGHLMTPSKWGIGLADKMQGG